MKKLLYTLVFLVAICCSSFAQESIADFRFRYVGENCALNQVCFVTQVKLNTANQPDGEISLADVNYRYFYPNNIMEFASLEGLQPGYFDPDISNVGPLGDEVLDLFGTAFDGTDGLGFMDYSIEVDGNGNAISLSDAWLSTSRICFEVVDPAQIPLAVGGEVCTQIIWSQNEYNLMPNQYLFSYLAGTEVEDGGGSGLDELTEEKIHYGWSEADMSLGQGCADIDCNPLPIELTEFNANLINSNEVSLDWKTSQEINSDYFEVQRKADGSRTNWETITIVNAAGNSVSEKNYDLMDRLPASGKVFHYRLKSFDKDETYVISNVRTINRESEKARLNVFPNPTSRYANVDFTVTGNKKLVEINLIDASGKTQVSNLLSQEMDAGNYIERVNLKSFPAGHYMLQVNISGTTQTTPLQIIK